MSITTKSSSARNRWSPSDLMEPQKRQGNGLIQRWNELTAIPESRSNADFAQRETARKSQMSSNILFFFTIMVVFLLPACYFAPYPSYFWLDLGLAISCVIALILNRQGQTLAAGILVNVAGFIALTVALFSTVPFDETTLQGYDMYVIVELLAVSLLPTRSVFIVFVASVGCILGTLLYMPHTVVLQNDLHERFLIIVARPIGTLLLVAGVAYILATTMTNAIKRAGQAEMIATLEHELADQKQELEEGIQQILSTHVAVANGNLSARAPLNKDNMLWQIARALNVLLVRLQRASQAEKELQMVEQAIGHYVGTIQQAEAHHQAPNLTLGHTKLDPLIAALQGQTINRAQLPPPPLPSQRSSQDGGGTRPFPGLNSSNPLYKATPRR
ncbi:hypothetical protein [Ktedonospora formicarum]|uniref:HAMP domain-containing protein n=1 Tax=Ktedonospora formicarum TaxID=2778364 RepID=A0A8J3I8E6_9CHLR|nr:hypothetical protein [Ktedonospora formicarum]GHO46584.1 hypothetical protein KSX_47470 [Ktedonospora formicarum]